MRFGRVIGTVSIPDWGPEQAVDGLLRLVVVLDDGRRVETVRSGLVQILKPLTHLNDLRWHADQYTQETIGNELALVGWEPIGLAPDEDGGAGATMAMSSPTYIVRQV